MTTIPITESPHTIAARELIERVRAAVDPTGTMKLRQRSESVRKLTVASTTPDDFIEAAAVALEASARLAAASEVGTAELRDAVAYSRAFALVLEELNLARRMLQQEITARRGAAGKKALDVYRLAKGLNATGEDAVLVPHVQAMKRLLGRSGLRKTARDGEVVEARKQ